ncbi:Membrane associated serine protease, rhomboid family [Saccharicrinis carchari]|uniref:Membrane associated serine protease, rhomboid family n=1 Tax=Saccharicrinis carchari TaxID=1168039 RepID=A0A521EU54_SACCC|nr:rhomboid family intramembrane serine protease [Saccharicrinis carchari]SMO87463.1 Membrane associated serine protease, rhomboid family [Saccharicrinis carchari]
MYRQRSIFSNIPSVVKNLLIINALAFFAMYIFSQGVNIPGLGLVRFDLNVILGLYTPGSEHFKFFQYISYMFMHGNLTHIFFNMFAVFMFGRILERTWGPHKFLFYYLVTGIGAGLLYVMVGFIRAKLLAASLPPTLVNDIYVHGQSILFSNKNYVDSGAASLNLLVNMPMVGASGAVFGLLLAFGMMFPDEYIYLYMLVPVKAKYFVMGYGGLEIYLMLQNNPGDNVAHLAHLGGMLFGFILIRLWRKRNIY